MVALLHTYLPIINIKLIINIAALPSTSRIQYNIYIDQIDQVLYDIRICMFYVLPIILIFNALPLIFYAKLISLHLKADFCTLEVKNVVIFNFRGLIVISFGGTDYFIASIAETIKLRLQSNKNA